MKKLIFTVLAALSFTACVHEKMEKIPEPGAITFGNSFVAYTTKAAEIKENNFEGFNVWGYMDDDRTDVWATVFEGNPVTKGSNNAWSVYTKGNDPQLVHKYWIPRKDYYFAGIAPMNSSNISASFAQAENKMGGTVSFTNLEGQQDLILSSCFRPGTEVGTSGNAAVDLTFNHLLSKVRVSFTNKVGPDINVQIADVKVNAQQSSTYDVATEKWSIDNVSTPGEFEYLEYDQLNLLTSNDNNNTGSTESLFLIPSNNYTISFNVILTVIDAYNNSVEIYNEIKSAKVTANEISKITSNDGCLEKGCAYNFIINVTPERLVGNNTFEIDDIKEEYWLEDKPLNNIVTQISVISKLGGEITLTEDIEIPNTIDVLDDFTINLNGHTITYPGNSGYMFNVVNKENITNDANKITKLTINGNDNDNSKIISNSTAGIATATKGGYIYINTGKFEAANASDIFSVAETGNISIRKGLFLKWDPAPSRFVIDGSRSAKIKINEIKYYKVDLIIPEIEIYDDSPSQTKDIKDALLNPFIDKIIIDEGVEISNPGNPLEINHDVIIEGENSANDITTGGITTKSYGFTIYGNYNITIKNLNIIGGGIYGIPGTDDNGNFVGDGPNILVENCEIETRYSTTGRNAFYIVDGNLTIKNTNVRMRHYDGSMITNGGGQSGSYIATGSLDGTGNNGKGGVAIVIKEEGIGKEGIFEGSNKGSGYYNGKIYIQGGKYQHDPTSKLSEGYQAIYNSSTKLWEVSKITSGE